MTSRMVMGIRGRLLLSFTALGIAIAVFLALTVPAHIEREALDGVLSDAAAVSNLTASIVDVALFAGDTAAMKELLRDASRAADVRWIAVRDAGGRVVATHGITVADAAHGDTATATTGDKRSHIASTPILHGRDRIGTLTIAIGLGGVQRQVRASERFSVVVGMLAAVVGFLLVFAISTIATRPLRAIVETVRRAADGDLTIRAAQTTNPEVDQLGRAFNRMVANLEEAHYLLASSNQELEARVEVRTAELHKSIELQRNVQTALADSEVSARDTAELLASLIEVAPQAVVTTDIELRVTRWNRAAEQLYGWTAPEVMGRPLPYYLPDGEFTLDKLRVQLADKDFVVEPRELVRVRKDGTTVPVLVAIAVLRDRSDAPVGYIGVGTDLTERKSLENQLRQSQKMEAVGRLAGGVAHDFNNILTIISATTGLMLNGERPDQDRRDLEEIMLATKRAANLTRQLLTFSRQGIVQLASVQLVGVIRGIEPMLRRLLPANIELTLDLDASERTLKADSTQLEQVIMNLVLNASDAMPAGGRVNIEARTVRIGTAAAMADAKVSAGDYVRLVVHDTGVGMDAATMSRIFEPFFTTKGVGKGSGLGLATTYAVVSQLGGHIAASSAPGQGATFTIHFPAEPRLSGMATPASVAAIASDATARRVILLVDDEPAVRKVVRRSLERAGHSVLEAADAESAIAQFAAAESRVDLVITDVMMPGLDGRALADRLTLQRPDLRVIFVSGYTGETVRQRGFVDPRHTFLQKPFSAGDLLRAIDESMLVDAARS